MTNTTTESDILDALKTLAGEGQRVYEIVLDGNKASVFKSIETAAAFAAKATKKPTTGAIYYVFNEIDPVKHAAYIKSEKAKGRKSPRTCDAVISKRRWVALDFDPKRDSGVCSTDAEKAKAREVAENVKAELVVHHLWPEPVEVDSGNGVHQYYPANIDNTPEAREAYRRLLAWLNEKFGSGDVIVDRTVYKAGQILRVPGTWNRKGESTIERPHRQVAIFSRPKFDREPVTLEALIATAQAETESPSYKVEEGNQLIAEAYAEDVGLELLEVDPIDRISPEGAGFTVYPCVCPFDPKHSRGEAALTVGTNGAIGFACKHHTCADQNWETVKELLGQPTFEHYPQPKAEDEFTAIETDGEAILDKPEKSVHDLAPRSASAIKSKADKPLRPCIVDGLFRRRDVVNIIAAPKVGKSWLSMGLALSVARGEKWLGFETKRGRVLMIDNELDGEDFDNRLNQVAGAMNIDLNALEGYLDVDNLRDRPGALPNILQLERPLGRLAGRYDLIILDALYRFIPPRMSENDNGDMTQIYNRLNSIAMQTGAAIVIVHHTSKGDQSRKASTDVGSGAGAISRCPDCHLTILRHETPGLAVINGDLRHYDDFDPFSIEFSYPLWSRSEEAPAVAIPKTRGEVRTIQRDEESLNKIASLLNGKPRTAHEIRIETGWGAARVSRLLVVGRDRGAFAVETVKSNKGTEQLAARKLTIEEEFPKNV